VIDKRSSKINNVVVVVVIEDFQSKAAGGVELKKRWGILSRIDRRRMKFCNSNLKRGRWSFRKRELRGNFSFSFSFRR
jgi:hypothetical protein